MLGGVAFVGAVVVLFDVLLLADVAAALVKFKALVVMPVVKLTVVFVIKLEDEAADKLDDAAAVELVVEATGGGCCLTTKLSQ
jgi:hypothetical protein